MLPIIRNVVLCSQPSNLPRFSRLIRLAGSLQQRHKEHSIKREDFFIDPNLKKAFEKFKKGDFTPTPINFETIRGMKTGLTADGRRIDQTAGRRDAREELLGKLVYTGKLDKPFKAAKSLSLASSLGGALCYPVMLPKILHEASIYVAIGYSIVSATFVLLTPSLIQMICKRYFTSLYYQEKTGQFTGFYKNFFMMERPVRFRAEDVQVPPITGMFTSMLIKDRPYFLNHDDFHDKEVLKKMLGYDKDFDFSKYTKDVQPNNDDDDDDDLPYRPEQQSRTQEQKKKM